jgi:hypothetical protein
VTAGIETNDGFETILSEGFESQSEIPDLPITLPVTPLENIKELYWYKENEDAMVQIAGNTVRSGEYSCLCNATLDGMGRTNMIKNLMG